RSPPTSAPYPSTTLFRSSRIEDLSNERAALRLEERIEHLSQMLEQSQQAAPAQGGEELAYYLSDISRKIDALDQGSVNDQLAERSEEHTSELQSRENLVC